VVTVIVVVTNRADTSTAEGAAEIAVDAFADKDSQALTVVLCTGTANPLEQAAPAPLSDATLGDVRLDGADRAVADVSIEYENNTTAQQQMVLRKQNATWCVASLQ
jgi:hypothetical protein